MIILLRHAGCQVTRVPGYHHRLKAMLFKANFAEKVEEVKTASSCRNKLVGYCVGHVTVHTCRLLDGGKYSG